MFKGRVGCGLGVDWIPVIAGLVLINAFLMIWCFTILNNRMQIAILTLDKTIAGAIKSVVSEAMTNFTPPEAVNPLQMALASMLAGSKPPGGATPPLEILRGTDGKFS